MKSFLILLLMVCLNPSFSRAESYASLDTSVRGYQLKIEDKRKKILELAEKKSAMTDQAQIRATLDEMVKEAKELKENFVKFQKEKKRLMYEYPSRGDSTEQKYKRFEVEVVEDLNSLSNIDLRIKGILSKLEKTYEHPVTKKEKSAENTENINQAEPTPRRTLKEDPTPTPSRPVLSY